MRTRSLLVGAIGALAIGAATSACFGQIGEKIGEGLQDVGRGVKRGVQDLGQGLQGVGRGVKRGTQDMGDAVRRQFDTVRADVQRMEAHSRLYSRLHWDQALHGSKIEVYMLRDGTALLTGTVPDQAAKDRAEDIARNTVGITAIINELNPMMTSRTNVQGATTRVTK